MKKCDILVNKKHPIDEKFNVGKLVSVGKRFSSVTNEYTDDDILLEETAALAFNEMVFVANKITPSIRVVPDSGYRSIDYQREVMKYYIEKEGLKKARKRVALPGTSEHHTGLAIDVAIFENGKYLDDVTGNELPIKFLHENAYKYGFILRYPAGKENITGYDYEPWHFRYVGKDLAEYLHENKLTLDEYHGQRRKFIILKF